MTLTIYEFPDLTDKNETMRVFHQHSNKSYPVSMQVKDEDFTQTSCSYVSDILADFVDLAAAVYVADWLSARRGDKVLNIEIKLPVRNPHTFSDSTNLDALQKLLFEYTRDHWHFNFCPRKKVGRRSEIPWIQSHFSFVDQHVAGEVALWSGGLDSLAGLCGRLTAQPSKQFTIIGTGTNTQVHGKQSEIAGRLAQLYPGRVKLVQIPIDLNYPQDHPATNDAFRARGFTFKLLGAVCAQLEHINCLSIYENGFGALNLPFTLSETGTSHTRSVHPLALLKTGKFISKLQNIDFRFDNPYLFSTKAQMCQAISKCSDIAFSTWSCDGRHRLANQPMQCGYCSSCLLRRISFLNALGFDNTGYVSGIGNCEDKKAIHFNAMQFQATRLESIFRTKDPWHALCERYDCLRQVSKHLSREQNISESYIQSQLLQLYYNHLNEWLFAEAALKQDLFGQASSEC